MAYNAAYIQTAIVELLEGTIGTTRTVTAGLFVADVFEAQDEQSKQALSLDRAQHFDVVLGEMRNNEATPLSGLSNFRLADLDIIIQVWRHANAENLRTQRFADLAAFRDALETALQALSFPDNLTQTNAANPTGIVGGCLLGPDGTGTPFVSDVDEDFVSELYRAEIKARAILNLSQVIS